MNRETWLENAVSLFRQHFSEAGLHLPKRIYVSVGWPSYGVGTSDKYVAGEAWPKGVSKDRSNHIFISPKLNNPVDVLTVLCHELVHAYLDCANGHQHWFQTTASAVGLQAPWISSVGTQEFRDKMQEWSKQLGTYPHAGFRQRSKFYASKSVNRSRKIICENCGFSARTSLKWVKKGLPTCSCGTVMTED